MPAPALRLSDRQLKAVKAKDKDYVLSDGDGLQLWKRLRNGLQADQKQLSLNHNPQLQQPPLIMTRRLKLVGIAEELYMRHSLLSPPIWFGWRRFPSITDSHYQSTLGA